jgi:hypothetical protein
VVAPSPFASGGTPGATLTNLGLGAANNVTFSNITASGTLGVTGNATFSGTANLAPSQTADSADSLMTRELSDDRYSFSRWYDANNLLSGAQNVGVNPLVTGNASGSIVSATLVTVSNVNTKFMLPVDYRLSGEVKVVSYWTDRGQTNSGTSGDIAVWAFPFVVQPTTDTTTNGDVSGTTIKNTFTANYGGMKLLLSNNQLTRYAKSGEYATTTAIPLDGPLALTAQTLLAWLQAQLTEGESVGQVFLEPDGTHSDYETSVDAEGNESQSVTSTRAKLSAAVTAHAAAGSRSVVFSSEALPAELRDGLLAAWAVIEGMP